MQRHIPLDVRIDLLLWERQRPTFEGKLKPTFEGAETYLFKMVKWRGLGRAGTYLLRGEAAFYFLEGCRYLFWWSGWARNLGATFWARQCSTFGEVETYLWWGGPNFGEFRDLSLVGRQIHTVTFEGRGGGFYLLGRHWSTFGWKAETCLHFQGNMTPTFGGRKGPKFGS